MVTTWAPLVLLALAVVPPILIGLWIRSLLRIRFGTAALLALAINVCVLFIVFCVANQPSWQQAVPDRSNLWQQLHSDQAPFVVLGLMILANLSIALLAKLYRAAVLNIATLEERAPGIQGVRVWLSPINIGTVIALAVSAYLTTNMGYLNPSLIGFAALLAYPLTNSVMQQSNAAGAAGESTSPPKAPADERQRVLALVEAGKITAEDGAELLTALAQSQAASAGVSATLSLPRRIMLVGAAIVLVGFFLPWFSLNVATGANEMVNGIRQTFLTIPGGTLPIVPQPPPSEISTQVPVENVVQATVRAGDVQHGLGWFILAAGLVAACLPFFWNPQDNNTRSMRNCIFAALAVGSVVELYVLSGSFNAITSIEPGFILALAGYVVLWVGSIREYLAQRPGFQPALAIA